jgi:hypothetical protein
VQGQDVVLHGCIPAVRAGCVVSTIAAGGCSAQNHAVSSSVTSATRNEGEDTQLSPLRSPPPSPHRSTSPPTTSSAKNGALDMFANPRHASQMTAAFTQHYARELELEEQRRAADALRIERHNKAKHNVIVYGWAKVCIVNPIGTRRTLGTNWTNWTLGIFQYPDVLVRTTVRLSCLAHWQPRLPLSTSTHCRSQPHSAVGNIPSTRPV